MTEPQHFWDDIDVGFTRETPPHTITKDEIITFAREYDPQPFHLDEEAARQSILGGLCASGWHTCSLAMRLVYDGFLSTAAGLGSPGIEECRWRKPLYVDDTIRVTIECIDRRSSESDPARGWIKWRWTMTNQHGETVMVSQSWAMFSRRSGAAA